MVNFRITKNNDNSYRLWYKNDFQSCGYKLYHEKDVDVWDNIEKCKEKAKTILERTINEYGGVIVEEFEL